MNSVAQYAYTQARLQAQHGMRADKQLWRKLQTYKELAGYLQFARQTVLQTWLQGFHAAEDIHNIEANLVHQLRIYIDRVSDWQPHDWRTSIRWLRHLLVLPALQHLLSGNSAPAWMTADEELKQFTASHLQQRVSTMQQSALAPMATAWLKGDSLLNGWLVHWRTLWPARSSYTLKPFEEFIGMMLRHLAAFKQISPERAWSARGRLEDKLTVLFRRHAFHPVAACIHIALLALDIEHLRADIVERRLLAEAVIKQT